VRHRLAFLGALLVAAACASSADQELTPAPTRPAATTRRFDFHYEATVKSAPEGSKQVDLWVPIAQDTPFQKVKLVGVTGPEKRDVSVEPKLGNKMMHVSVPAASLPVTLRLDYEVDRAERKTDLGASSTAALSPSDRARYLAGSELVPVGPQVLTMSGFQCKEGDPVAKARQAYDHVLSKMKYDKPANSGWGKGSTEWACKEGFGNCTDFHAYFMSLTRTCGVPSRFVMGMPLPTDKKEGEIAGYHCWAEFFVNGKGWVPVDASEASKIAAKDPKMADFYFGGLTADRVELSAGRDVDLVPAQHGKPRNFFVYPYVEIDGKEAPADVVARKFTFKDR
jgi:transglutaminase-like putative cysteine protease